MNRPVDYLEAVNQVLNLANDLVFGSKKEKARGRRKTKKVARQVQSKLEKTAEQIGIRPRKKTSPFVRGLRTVFLFGLGVAAANGVSRLLREQRRMDFVGKNVIITGGARGLGLVLARQFATEGANVALLGTNQAELNRAGEQLAPFGVRVMPIVCDITHQDQVDKAVQWVVDDLGRVDVLVNNAGIIQVGPIDHMTQEDFESAMAVHFWGSFYTIQAVKPFMMRQGGGRIINISSIGGQVAVPHLAPYTASKFALTGLSDALRAELSRYNILISTVCPGLMRTGSHINARVKGQHEKEYAWFSIGDGLPFTSMDAERAAGQVIEAGRYAIPKRTLSWQAHSMVVLEALFPNLFATLTRLVNRLVLPDPVGPEGDQIRMGYESYSELSPSWMTAMADQEVERNNEAPAALVPDEIKGPNSTSA